MNEYEQMHPVMHRGLRAIAMSLESGYYLPGDDQTYQASDFDWIGEPLNESTWNNKEMAA